MCMVRTHLLDPLIIVHDTQHITLTQLNDSLEILITADAALGHPVALYVPCQLVHLVHGPVRTHRIFGHDNHLGYRWVYRKFE